MKKLIIVGLLCFPFLMKGQDTISRKEFNQFKNDLTYVKENLNRSHEEFKKGTILIGCGLTFSSLVFTTNPSDYKMQRTILVIGGLMTATGVIFQIDSHRWIGKAGASGLTVGYKF